MQKVPKTGLKSVPPPGPDHGSLPSKGGGRAMITREVFMDIVALHRQGCTLREISRKLGIHLTMITKYLNSGQTPQYEKSEKIDPRPFQADDKLLA